MYLLKRIYDSQRLVQKFTLGRGDAEDLLALASTIFTMEELVKILKLAYERSVAIPSQPQEGVIDDKIAPPAPATCLKSLTDRFNLRSPIRLASRIKAAIDEEGIEAQNRMDDQETDAMLALAEEVVTAQGTTDDAAAILPKKAITMKKKRAMEGIASASSALATTATSIRGAYSEENQAWIMKPNASVPLSKLHESLQDLNEKKESLEEGLRARFSAASLKLKWTPMLGHICHVKGRDVRTISEASSSAVSSQRKAAPTVVSASRSTRSLQVAEWTALGQKIDQARLRVRAEETRIFRSLRQEVIRNLVTLRRNARVLDELDVACGFALLAQEQNLVRPILREDPSTGHNVVGGRHPTVESGLGEHGRMFISNDCFVGSGSGQHGRLWLITGPNMAGKSTFLRQNALITILAQVGCYVPADFAEIGIIDAIFARVGSADSLYHDQSTFMVEMLETATILRTATDRSFVIMDEIGRGTSPRDGTAVAFACLQHLATVNKCRSLFATHFHDLADMIKDAGLDVETNRGPVNMYCTDIEDDEATGGFVFVHRLRKGVNRESHALKVAELAGLPSRAIKMARDAMMKQERPSSGSESPVR